MSKVIQSANSGHLPASLGINQGQSGFLPYLSFEDTIIFYCKKVEKDIFLGRGTSTDIVEASAKAYLNAINKVVYREKKVKGSQG